MVQSTGCGSNTTSGKANEYGGGGGGAVINGKRREGVGEWGWEEREEGEK